ncbi:hypothetical protein H0H93_000270 [Arthromyces matolae]|nr:hypothetical protein H0H93_000270 [Arthromyces matolae]
MEESDGKGEWWGNERKKGKFNIVQVSQDEILFKRRERAAANSLKKVIKKGKGSRKATSSAGDEDVEMGVPLEIPTHTHFLPSPEPSPPSPEPLGFTRVGRPYRLPQRFRDILPEPTSVQEQVPDPEPRFLPRVRLIVRDRLITALNSFNMWREYPHRPSYIPDTSVPLSDLAETPLSFKGAPEASLFERPPPWPFPNMSIFRLMRIFNSGSTLTSEDTANRCVKEVIQASDFSVDDFDGFDARKENARLDEAISDSESSPYLRQFTSTSIDIQIPSGERDVPSTKFSVPGLLYRKITSVIEAAFHGPLADHLHLSPFKLFHRNPATGIEERVFGEIYTSEAFLSEHDLVQRRAPVPPEDPDCKREKVVAAIMFSSDATHLTNFGTAKAWPIYLMLGNLSKYFRSLPNTGALHHLAYIPSLPDSFQDIAATAHSKWKTQKKSILTHCRRELMHAVWDFLFDDDFIHAFKYGMVIKCVDGIERRVYPRLFTYSADYPEKILLATIRDKGLCPCPRCLVPKSLLDRLGLARDGTIRTTLRRFMMERVVQARRLIYELGQSITGVRVENLLKDTSSNAFVKNLSQDSEPFEPANMLVVDLLHEFELGVWKTTFRHLIRILYAASPQGNLVAELDLRYRQTPTFGRDTIRKFATNASEMKKLAARDFEDLLQCSIPAFEDLLPEPHNKRLMKLLYRTAEWHALAKARMHTDTTLNLLEELTTEFGKLLRQFRDLTCSEFNTVELPGEAAARIRRIASTQSDQPPSTTTNSGPQPQVQTRRTRTLNLNLYKLHALGDYVKSIRLFGTTDSYSTQLGELAHRLVKMLYARTNKKNALTQIAKQVNRRDALRDSDATVSETVEQAELASTPLSIHHVISHSRRKAFNLYEFVAERHNNLVDPAKKNFIPKLQDHLLGRLLGRSFDGDDVGNFTNEDRNAVHIVGNTIYSVQHLRVNYTTYDVRRASDTISPRNHSFVMLRSPESGDNSHPFWYAQVLGIFHAVVRHAGPRSRNIYVDHEMEFLWVRWLGVEPGYRSGRPSAKLPKIGFVPEDDPLAFGFLDPACVIRGAHLIPTFTAGKTQDLLAAQHSVARPLDVVEDWVNFYVNIFVDRDTFFRHLGFGIGHSSTMVHQPVDITSAEQDFDIGGDDIEATATDIAEERVFTNEGNEDDEPEDDDDDDDDESEDESEGEGEDDEDDENYDVGYADM